MRVEGSFTSSELRELVRKWGLVAEPSWDRSSSDLVRGLLREADKTFGTAELVRRLRLEKPLTEWPDVESGDAEKWGPKSATPLDDAPTTEMSGADVALLEAASHIPDLEAPTSAPTAGGANDLGSLDPLGTPESPAPIDEAPLSASAEQAAPTSRSAAASIGGPQQDTAPPSSGVRSQPAPSRSKPSLPFPGTTAVPEPKARSGIDPKILVLVAALMFGLAVVAFGAGFLWSRKPVVAPADGPKSRTTVRANGLAARASQVLDTELLGVATRCEVDVEGSPSSEILASAQEGCGRSVRETRRRIANGGDSTLPSPDLPRPRPRDSQATDDPRPVRPRGAGAPQKPACITSCATLHTSCMTGCGAEPGDASKFDVWQACSGRCLASESRCRLSCR